MVERNIKPIPEFSPRNNIWKYNTGRNYSSKDAAAFEHPAIYPEQLVKDHILTWSSEDDLVLDPFMGSGTTAVICKDNNRNYLGYEIDEKYYNVCLRRLKEHVPVKEVSHKKPTTLENLLY